MDDIGFILLSYGVSFGATVVLAWRVLRRGRVLTAQLPDEDQPWI